MTQTDFGNIQAVIFDVLHTLVDDSGFPRYQLKRMLEEEGTSFDPSQFEEIYNELTAREYDWEEAAVEDPFRSMKDRHVSRLENLYSRLNLHVEREISADIGLLWEKIRSVSRGRSFFALSGEV